MAHVRDEVSSRPLQFAEEDGGSELVEYALSLSLLVMVMFGVIDGSRVVYVHHFLAQAAESGVRYASTRGSTWSSACSTSAATNCVASATNVASYVAGTATVGISASNLTVSATWPGIDPDGNSCNSSSVVNATGCLVSVTANYAFQFTLPFLPHLSIPLSNSATGVVQQ